MTRRQVDQAALAAHFQQRAEDKMYEIDDPPTPAPVQTYTAGKTALERVPAMPMLANSDPTEDGAFAVASGQALAAGAGGVFEHTSAADRARADLLRLAYYAGALLVLIIGVAFLLWSDWWQFGSVLMLLGAGSMIIAAVVHTAGLRHSQAGVARHKVDTIRAMHKDRLESRERMAMQMSGAWLQLVGKQMDHEQRMEELRYKNGRK